MCGSKNRTLATLVTPPAAAAGMPSATAVTSPRKTSLAQIPPYRQTPLLHLPCYRGLRYSAYFTYEKLAWPAQREVALGYGATGSGRWIVWVCCGKSKAHTGDAGTVKALGRLTGRAGQRRREGKFIRIIMWGGGGTAEVWGRRRLHYKGKWLENYGVWYVHDSNPLIDAKENPLPPGPSRPWGRGYLGIMIFVNASLGVSNQIDLHYLDPKDALLSHSALTLYSHTLLSHSIAPQPWSPLIHFSGVHSPIS